MERTKAQTAQAKACNRRSGFDPSGRASGVRKSQTDVHGVTGLHRDEGAPDEDGAAVEEAGDDVGEQEEEVGTVARDAHGQVFSRTVAEGLGKGGGLGIGEEGGGLAFGVAITSAIRSGYRESTIVIRGHCELCLVGKGKGRVLRCGCAVLAAHRASTWENFKIALWRRQPAQGGKVF